LAIFLAQFPQNSGQAAANRGLSLAVFPSRSFSFR
jgi:hypothetical protein